MTLGSLSCLSAGSDVANLYADQVWSVGSNQLTVNSVVVLDVAFVLPRGAVPIALKSELGMFLKRLSPL